MKRKASRKPAPQKEGLAIRAGSDAPLSRTQLEFNRLVKTLETTKARHLNEQARLDETLEISIRELMPLIEDIKRANRDIVLGGLKALRSLKLTAKNRDLKSLFKQLAKAFHPDLEPDLLLKEHKIYELADDHAFRSSSPF